MLQRFTRGVLSGGPMRIMSGVLLVASFSLLASTATAAPVYWTLSNVNFDFGGSASGSFTFDPDAGTPCSGGNSPCGVYSNVNIVTTTGTQLPGATYHYVCEQDVPTCTVAPSDSTLAVFLASNASNQSGDPGIELFFTGTNNPTPPSGLTDAGGIVSVDGSDFKTVGIIREFGGCAGSPCNQFQGFSRSSDSGVINGTVGVPEPGTWELLLVGAAVIFGMRRRPISMN